MCEYNAVIGSGAVWMQLHTTRNVQIASDKRLSYMHARTIGLIGSNFRRCELFCIVANGNTTSNLFWCRAKLRTLIQFLNWSEKPRHVMFMLQQTEVWQNLNFSKDQVSDTLLLQLLHPWTDPQGNFCANWRSNLFFANVQNWWKYSELKRYICAFALPKDLHGNYVFRFPVRSRPKCERHCTKRIPLLAFFFLQKLVIPRFVCFHETVIQSLALKNAPI